MADGKQRITRLDADLLGVAGLGLVAVLAGVTKFTHPFLWQGYEPAFIQNLFAAAGVNPMLVFGLLETLLGLAIILGRRWYLTFGAFFWLLIITVQVASLGLWDLVIRDLGLTVYAATVTLYQYQRRP